MIVNEYFKEKHKNYFKFMLFLLFLITQFNAFAQEVLDNIITEELSKEQLWAIALTGIMSERNRSNNSTLSTSWTDYRYRAVWLEVLRRDWGITTREELLETLDDMENYGHAGSLEYIKSIILEKNVVIYEIDENNVLVTTELDFHYLSIRGYNYLVFTYSNWDLLSNRTILAWDLGRNIALCRWGYDVGFLSEEEAWEKIMYYARIIQPLYNSWEEYGYDYYIGRVFWASGFGEENRYNEETIPIYEKLINRNGLWYNLEWNIDLK